MQWSGRRHGHCRDALSTGLNTHGECNVIEQIVTAARSDGESRRDLVVATSGGTRARWDVAVTHVLTAAAMRNGASACRGGVAVTQMENPKRLSYPGVHVTPAAVDTHGRIGKSLLEFIRNSRQSGRQSQSIGDSSDVSKPWCNDATCQRCRDLESIFKMSACIGFLCTLLVAFAADEPARLLNSDASMYEVSISVGGQTPQPYNLGPQFS